MCGDCEWTSIFEADQSVLGHLIYDIQTLDR